jgi:hypothetical protein
MEDNQKKETSPRTVGLIERIFDTYHNLDLEKTNKNLYMFTFEIGDYIFKNEKYPEYLKTEEDLSIIDIKNDFWIKSDCFYMTETN